MFTWMSDIPAILLICPGALFLFFGWQLHRLTFSFAAAIFGVFVGYLGAHMLGLSTASIYALPVALAVAFVAVAVAFERLAIFVLGGVAGLMSLQFLPNIFDTEAAYLFWALIMFLVGGSCVVLFLRPLVILASAFIGAVLVTGALMRLMQTSTYSSITPTSLIVFFILLGAGILCQATSQWQPPTPSLPSHPTQSKPSVPPTSLS